MQDKLSSVIEELVRLKSEGEEHVYVSDETLELLKPEKTIRLVNKKKEQLTQELEGFDAELLSENSKASKNTTTKPSNTYGKPLPKELPVVQLPEGDSETRMSWLRQKVESCQTCNDHLSPSGKVVFGVGNPSANIFFCGEAPGADEELAGEPFVGPAGKLLTKIIQAMGLRRDDVYIGNILKWRPEHDKPYGNRPPTIEEMDFCMPYLRAQIEIVQPRVIVALGNTAVSGLLGPDPKRKLGNIRGQWHIFGNIPLMVTFHPSYLLRNGTLGTKRKVWEDMLKVMEKTEMEISDKQRGFFLPKD